MDEQNYNGGARGRVATEFVLVTEAFMAPHGGARALEGVSCANVLLMHAWCDNNTDPAGSVAFYERAQCAGSKALLLFGGDADASELRTAGPPTAHAEFEALKRRHVPPAYARAWGRAIGRRSSQVGMRVQRARAMKRGVTTHRDRRDAPAPLFVSSCVRLSVNRKVYIDELRSYARPSPPRGPRTSRRQN